ncbi:hypothetical protein [Salinispora pacifica]|nr:hypothetical protein [Salinispora pacifica]
MTGCVTCGLPENRWDPADRLYLCGGAQCPDCIRVDLDDERRLDHQEAA